MFYTLIKQVSDQSERAQGPIYILIIITSVVCVIQTMSASRVDTYINM